MSFVGFRRSIIPIYEYQCNSCGLQFDKKQKASLASEPVGCDCGEQADRMVPDTFNSTYVVKGDGSVGPQNTGVSSYDSNVDRVIGDHSENSWQHIQKRHSRKRDVLRSNPNKTGFDLGRTMDNDYRVLKSEEREASETARGVHSKAIQRIERWKKKNKIGTTGS